MPNSSPPLHSVEVGSNNNCGQNRYDYQRGWSCPMIPGLASCCHEESTLLSRAQGCVFPACLLIRVASACPNSTGLAVRLPLSGVFMG
jgi:hypothetical protein